MRLWAGGSDAGRGVKRYAALVLALAIGPMTGFIVTWLRVYAAYGWNAAWIQIQQWPG